jgi:environmental stress-induced protein Ves
MVPESLHHFHRTGTAPTPWKNGQGTTLELACEPTGAGTGDFGWRVSIAAVAADAPFSAFDGVDRSITLLAGEGMRLLAPEGGLIHDLDKPLQPFSFSGELPLRAVLRGGRCEDFNVMTRRGEWRSDVQVLRRRAVLPPCDRALWFAASGAWRLQLPQGRPIRLDPGAGCRASRPPGEATLEPLNSSSHAALIAVLLWSVS